jgi:hypothetical protein
VELRRDKARLAFHECRIVPPSIEKRPLIRFVEREQVDENDRAGLDCDLALNRELWVEGAQ